VRFAGRLFLVLSVPLTCFYMRDVPQAFNYLNTGILPQKLSVQWLEYSIRPYYLPNKFTRKVIRAVLPGSALGSSLLLLLFGCIATAAGQRVKVSRFESFIWTALGALLLGLNAMTTWIIWEAFVFM
jgi:hypothetical protein